MWHLPSIGNSPTTPRRTALLGGLVAAATLLAFAWAIVAAPSSSHPMFYEPATLVGVPLEFVIMVVGVVWGLIGGYLVGSSSSVWIRLVAVVFFTLPAVAAMLLAPALVLILRHLG